MTEPPELTVPADLTGPARPNAPAGRSAWIDASAGIAGDMLLGALVDAGADLRQVQSAVDALVPGSARLTRSQVIRAGQRATKVDVEILVDSPAHRRWADLRELLGESALPEPVREGALGVFTRLAAAEAHVHGVAAEVVHFHEVGAIDSIADIVGVCAALQLLGIRQLTAGPAAVGSGRIKAAHGDLSIPGPAVTELARGWRVCAGGDGELTTPTGMALLTALSSRCEELPLMTVDAVGVGAGTRDIPGRPNVTRVLVGTAALPGAAQTRRERSEEAIVLEANVDDLDPRIWPGVLEALLAAGAADAWLVPITMKKGRPAHTLTVLSDQAHADALRALMFRHTSSFGVRQHSAQKFPLQRAWVDVLVDGTRVPIKIAYQEDVITRATPEFDDVTALAAELGEPVLNVLDQARLAATQAGLRPGDPVPTLMRDRHTIPGSTPS